jgi:hypothetical protein
MIMEFSILSILTPNNSKSSSVGEIVTIAYRLWPVRSLSPDSAMILDRVCNSSTNSPDTDEISDPTLKASRNHLVGIGDHSSDREIGRQERW